MQYKNFYDPKCPNCNYNIIEKAIAKYEDKPSINSVDLSNSNRVVNIDRSANLSTSQTNRNNNLNTNNIHYNKNNLFLRTSQ